MEFLSAIISGLSMGGTYAMIALGYTMVYGIAKMLNLKEITLYKETGGIMSGDPLLIASPYLIRNLSFDDAYMLSKLGAKVIQNDAVNYAKENKIKIIVKSLYLDEVGSVIYFKSDFDVFCNVSIVIIDPYLIILACTIIHC